MNVTTGLFTRTKYNNNHIINTEMNTPTEEELEELEKKLKRRKANRGVHALHDQTISDPELDPDNLDVVDALERIGQAVRRQADQELGLQDEPETIEDIHSQEPSPRDAASYELIKEKIIDVMENDLSERERNVLCLRFGLKAGYAPTLEEVGRQFKVARERIRAIEAKALKKMKHPKRIRDMSKFFDEESSSIDKPKPEALRQLGL
jgi:RNA polymerase sigma factor (sigma-70 family)